MNNNVSLRADKFNFDFGTKPTTDQLEEIKVEIHPDLMIGDFGIAYAKELMRRNPVKFEAWVISRESEELDHLSAVAKELTEYFTGLIQIRVDSVVSSVPKWREAKKLYIPTWIQFTLTQIGEVVDTVRGLRFTPAMSETYDINNLLVTSDKLRAFIVDGVSMHLDAFPRDREGDKDLMGMAIIDGYVRSMSELPHPIYSYVSAFLGAKLESEAAFKMLYRVRYDDVEFIRSMLMHEEALI